MFIGRTKHFLDQIGSTNNYASKLMSKSEPTEGTVVISYNQTAGKGQPVMKNGILVRNVWHGAAGLNLAISIILRPTFLKVTEQFLLNMVVSNALQKLLTSLSLLEVSIKWPNDIYINKKKVAGILIENSIQSNRINTAVVGVGLNINEVDFPEDLPNPTSLKRELNILFDLEELTGQLFSFFEVEYLKLKSGQYDSIKHFYQQQLFQYQEKCKYLVEDKEVYGSIMGVNERGSLILQINETFQEFQMKELRFMF